MAHEDGLQSFLTQTLASSMIIGRNILGFRSQYKQSECVWWNGDNLMRILTLTLISLPIIHPGTLQHVDRPVRNVSHMENNNSHDWTWKCPPDQENFKTIKELVAWKTVNKMHLLVSYLSRSITILTLCINLSFIWRVISHQLTQKLLLNIV